MINAKKLVNTILLLLFILISSRAFSLQIGDQAPEFSLRATTNENINLSDFKGEKNLIIFFYIGAFTNTWTQEALAFQLDLPKFEALNTQVLGVSVDFNDTNRHWADLLGLTYPLLSDVRRSMSRSYQVLNDNPDLIRNGKIAIHNRSKRAWFVIDRFGIIRYMNIESSELVSSDELLKVILKLTSR